LRFECVLLVSKKDQSLTRHTDREREKSHDEIPEGVAAGLYVLKSAGYSLERLNAMGIGLTASVRVSRSALCPSPIAAPTPT